MLQIFAKSTLIAIFINNFLVIYSTEIKMIKYFQTFLGVLLISNFRHVYMLYVFFWVIPRRLNFICRRFGTLCLLHLHRQVGVHLPAYEDGTECSETSAYKIQTPGNYPEENIQPHKLYVFFSRYYYDVMNEDCEMGWAFSTHDSDCNHTYNLHERKCFDSVTLKIETS